MYRVRRSYLEEGKGHWEGQLERNNTSRKEMYGTNIPWSGNTYPMVWKYRSHGSGNTDPMVWKYRSHGLEIHIPWFGNTYPMVWKYIPMVWKMEIRFLYFEAVK